MPKNLKSDSINEDNLKAVITPLATTFNTVNNTTYNDLIKIATDIATVFNTVNTVQSTYAPLTNPTFTGTVTVPTAVNQTDAINLAQLQNAISSGKMQQNVRAATTASITLSGVQTIDGISLQAGDRVLVKDQISTPTKDDNENSDIETRDSSKTTSPQNGIYTVSTGAWQRTNDFMAGTNVDGYLYSVNEGTVNGSNFFKVRSSGSDMPVTSGTSNITFDEIDSLSTAQVNNIINTALSPVNTNITNLQNSSLMNYPTATGGIIQTQLLNTAIASSAITLTLPTPTLNYVYLLGNASNSSTNVTYAFPAGTNFIPAGSTTASTSIILSPGKAIKVAFNTANNQFTETI